MRPTISTAYKEQLTNLHASNPNWGTSGYAHYEQVKHYLINSDMKSVLDVGCGKGTLIEALADDGYIVQGYDPAIPKFSDKPKVADLVICTDVLEHIEPEHLEEFLSMLSDNCERKLYAAISLVPAKQILPDGRNAHLIVQPAHWWLERLGKYFGALCVVRQTEKELVVYGQ